MASRQCLNSCEFLCTVQSCQQFMSRRLQDFHLPQATDCRLAQPVTPETVYCPTLAGRRSKPRNLILCLARAGIDPTTSSTVVQRLTVVPTRQAIWIIICDCTVGTYMILLLWCLDNHVHARPTGPDGKAKDINHAII